MLLKKIAIFQEIIITHTRDVELLAPGGDLEAIKAAIVAGADAVYFGIDKFNARNRAKNISLDLLNPILRLAHTHDCQLFLTLNIVIVESELAELFKLLNYLVNTSLDGVIVQDLGLFYILQRYFPSLSVHASTQCTTHNSGQLRFLQQLGVDRANFCRELNLSEIKTLAVVGHEVGISNEIFVHGANCVSFSGLCYMSSSQGNSGNRGRCSQPCRSAYASNKNDVGYPLNMKDSSAHHLLQELMDAGADSLKIEGRIKDHHYVYAVVKAWRENIGNFQQNLPAPDPEILHKMFNRGLTDGFLSGQMSSNDFSDNPRDNSARFHQENSCTDGLSLEEARAEVNEFRAVVGQRADVATAELSLEKADLTLRFSGECGEKLSIQVVTKKETLSFDSEQTLRRGKVKSGERALDSDTLMRRFKSINSTGVSLAEIDLSSLAMDATVPFSELAQLRNRIVEALNQVPIRPTVDFIKLKREEKRLEKSRLAVLISNADDLKLVSGEPDLTIYFALPNNLAGETEKWLEFFAENPDIIPWFPSLLIGDHYNAAVEILHGLDYPMIISDNSGIGFEAGKEGQAWTAGPNLNLVNSYAFKALQEKFNCCGAFVSNEISRKQIQMIKSPKNFSLLYRIYSPLELMTSRHCLTQNCAGCDKVQMDEFCLPNCNRVSQLTTKDGEQLFIHKTFGRYHQLYHQFDYLNCDVITDMPHLFSTVMIDLRTIETATSKPADITATVKLFRELVATDGRSNATVHAAIHPTINRSYSKGL